MTIKRVATGGGPFEEATVLLRRMRELQATLDARENKYTETERRLALSQEQLMKRFGRVPMEHSHSRKTIGCVREDMSTLAELSKTLRQESERCAQENIQLKAENQSFVEENKNLQMQIQQFEAGNYVEYTSPLSLLGPQDSAMEPETGERSGK
uniref:Uncharacterized protein n=1 Tax=Rhodosorus marinus TaxID=101924 RepID=A0A6T6PLY3_9RHOD|mmetsp:Transcript_3804/g.5387  ORF Transcript_3804/g.5387 Transcript_3804/m.5387 type:complete len:154 (+) Transcript_3804:202-663(+)